jgi:muconolactone delta-isomerase
MLVSLQATGEIPIEFEGEELHHWTGRRLNGQERNRFFELTIYSLKESGYLGELVWKTFWQGEYSNTSLFDCDTKEEVVEYLYDFDPLTYLMGYPNRQDFAEKQIALESRIESDFRILRGEICKELGITRPFRRQGKPSHPLGVCKNPGWSLPKQVRLAVNEQAVVEGSTPSAIATEIIATHYGLVEG